MSQLFGGPGPRFHMNSYASGGPGTRFHTHSYGPDLILNMGFDMVLNCFDFPRERRSDFLGKCAPVSSRDVLRFPRECGPRLRMCGRLFPNVHFCFACHALSGCSGIPLQFAGFIRTSCFVWMSGCPRILSTSRFSSHVVFFRMSDHINRGLHKGPGPWPTFA